MTVGDAWHIGVYHPVSNRSCRYPCRRSTTLNGAVSAGASSITLSAMTNGTDSTSFYPQHIWAPGDIVKLGPSTHADNLGKEENIRIVSCSTHTLTTTPVTTYSYSSGDPVGGVGSLFPGEWSHYDSGHQYSVHLINSIGEGYDDNQALYMTKVDGNAIYIYCGWYNGGGRGKMYIPSKVYFHSLFYKATALSGSIHFDFAQLSASATHTLSDTSSVWTEASGAHTSYSTKKTAFPYLFLNFNATCTALAVDCITICHAIGSTDEASGIYTFSDLPEAGSIVQYSVNKNKLVAFDSNKYVGNSAAGDDIKYAVSAKFTDVPTTLWDELAIFKHWQDKGNLLCLRTHLPSLPPYMIGRLTVSGKKQSWDLNRCDLTLSFIEA